MKLVIGNKMYSSWSFRPWLLMRALGLAFEEQVVPLDTDEFSATLAGISPAAKVPVLIDGETTVWDTLAITEYLAERFPDAGVWPKDDPARWHARSAVAEMHSGFGALRAACPMNFGKLYEAKDRGPDVAKDVARIEALWAEARDRFGAASGAGPFLYGTFTAADAFYAPVVSRLRTYGIAVQPMARAYMEAVEALPAYEEWRQAGLDEAWVVAADEVDEEPIEILRRV